MQKNLLLILTAIAVTVVSGCNTFRGAGKDVESAGEGMQNIADKND